MSSVESKEITLSSLVIADYGPWDDLQRMGAICICWDVWKGIWVGNHNTVSWWCVGSELQDIYGKTWLVWFSYIKLLSSKCRLRRHCGVYMWGNSWVCQIGFISIPSLIKFYYCVVQDSEAKSESKQERWLWLLTMSDMLFLHLSSIWNLYSSQ